MSAPQFQFDRSKFFAAYKLAYPSKLNQSQVDGLSQLLSFIESDSEIIDLAWAAYMLATVKHECADRWQPVIEFGNRSYFDKYDAGTKIGKRLGNTVKGDGYRYRGRGYVQITGRANYQRMNDRLGLDDGEVSIYQNPDNALDPYIAYRIMSVGMRLGMFTGFKLSHFLPDPTPPQPGQVYDYFNARRIINGLDRAELIASCARQLESILKVSLLSDCERVDI